jgi:uncharacterized membrane-anchored protein YitT (DUF2179 family)
VQKRKSREALKSIAYLLIGSVIFALGYQLFMAPADVIIGGATGVATVAHILFGFPVGLGVILVNLPLLIWSILKNGFRSVMLAIPGILLTSLLLDAFSFLPMIETNPFFSAVLGGVVSGFGIGLLLARGYTTGGSELAATLLHGLFPPLTVGNWVLIIDATIISGAALLMGKIDVLFYSIVVSLSFAVVLDLVVGGAERGKLAFILSSKDEELVRLIRERFGRGTLISLGKSEGERGLLLCALRRRELYHVRELVKKVDEGALILAVSAEQIQGVVFSRREKGPVEPPFLS